MTTERPTGALYHSPVGLYPFQEESIARDYLKTQGGGGMMVVWDTGTGKSHFGLRMATLLAEDARDGLREHDLTIVLCEQNKLGEWVADFEEFTGLSVRKHYGPNRLAHLEKKGLPDVLVTTYETAKADLVKVIRHPGKGKRGERREGGVLFEAIEGKSVLWLGDEFAAKLGNRTSDNYKAFHWVFGKMKKSRPRDHRVFALTATPIETGYENAFNQGRLLFPERMPTVDEFEKWMVRSRHPVYGTPRYKAENIDDFVALFDGLIDRRRKSDPDIMAQFPKMVERSAHIEMARDQAALYDLVESLQDDEDDIVPGLWTVLRMVAGHPASIPLAARYGQSQIAKMLVEELGPDYFEGVSSAKEKDLHLRLSHVVKEEQRKAVVFTFFGQTVLPVLARNLRAKGFKVYENHGALTEAEATMRRQQFRADPEPCIYLTSDAGCRGINLPEATYLHEYESALTYSNRTQRINRIHRITSTSESVLCVTSVLDHTIEVPIIEKVMDRNEQSDRLLGDDDAGENFLSATERRAALQIGRLHRKRRKKAA